MTAGERLPVVYVPHGGGPFSYVDLGLPRDEVDGLVAYWRSVAELPKAPPRALLVVSAHWEEPVPTLMTSPRPPMLYDYYGFPPESYRIQWPAPGAPELAGQVRSLLTAAGIPSAEDPERGFDHGTFVPLGRIYPRADVPTLQLSLRKGLDPAEHLALGRALAPLRNAGVFIIASGMSYHNLRALFARSGGPDDENFDGWLRDTVTRPQPERDARLAAWESAPGARQVHPREEHLLPLMVAAGAAGDDLGHVPFTGKTFGKVVSAVHFG